MEIDSTVLNSKLKEFFGFDAFKGDQEAIIRNLLDGKDTFVLMPTGGGKSLCFQLPALVMPGTAIVISPLIALMKNQVDVIRGFVEEQNGIAHFLNSSLGKAQIQEVRKDVLSGVTKLLYVAPESLTKEENVDLLKEVNISFYAIDEAHCISEWGHDFRPEYRRIRNMIQSIGRAPVIALTATATPKVQNDIQKNLGIMDATVFKSSFNRPNLYYEVRDKVEPEKDIIRYIKQHPGKSGIVYCLSRKRVEEMANLLCINGIKALPYHAGLDAKTRAENQDRFLMEDVDVIVATIAFGMGIDKPDVRFVIHFDIPKSIEGYYQETGRAGRDGEPSDCITFYSYKDIQKLEKFMLGKPISEQEIGRQLLMETVAYAETNRCRRKMLLNYFGEDYPKDNCGICDNCVNPKPTFDGRKEMCLVIRLIKSLPEHFKIEHLSLILSGKANAMLKSYHHDTIPLFGAGSDHSEKFWSSVIHQGLQLHLLEKEIETYGLLYVTEKGEDFFAHPYEIRLVEDRIFQGNGTDDDDEDTLNDRAAQRGGGGDQNLLAMLKGLRKDMAKRLHLQPWILFGDPALDDMSILYPITYEELHACQGVGEGKARKYGKEFIHFGLTSQDINNTSVPLSIKEALAEVYIPLLEELIEQLHDYAEAWKTVPMLAKTHGQPASPTRLGKEIMVYVYRLEEQLRSLKDTPITAKFGGATGNFNAHHVAYPQYDWREFGNKFVSEKLGLEREQYTTQISNYDWLGALFDAMRRINTIVIDLDRDFWMYISMDYFKQKIKKGEVGSSAMPHKVNPIDYENSEGNLGIANAILQFLAAKLPVSRLQRDLTDSTVLRNVGVPMGHALIAFQSTLKGLRKLILNEQKLQQDLDNTWAVVAEGIQTILRREAYPNPYETLKALTRTNEGITAETIARFIDTLDVSESVKEELRAITPSTYTGI